MKNLLSEAGENFEKEILKNSLKDTIITLADSTATIANPLSAIAPPFSFLSNILKAVYSFKEVFLIEKTVSFLNEIAELNKEGRKRAIKEFDKKIT